MKPVLIGDRVVAYNNAGVILRGQIDGGRVLGGSTLLLIALDSTTSTIEIDRDDFNIMPDSLQALKIAEDKLARVIANYRKVML